MFVDCSVCCVKWSLLGWVDLIHKVSPPNKIFKNQNLKISLTFHMNWYHCCIQQLKKIVNKQRNQMSDKINLHTTCTVYVHILYRPICGSIGKPVGYVAEFWQTVKNLN